MRLSGVLGCLMTCEVEVSLSVWISEMSFIILTWRLVILYDDPDHTTVLRPSVEGSTWGSLKDHALA